MTEDSPIRSLGYMRIEATDIAAWRDYGLKVLGMVEGKAPTRQPLPADGRFPCPSGDRPVRPTPPGQQPAGGPNAVALQDVRDRLSAARVIFREARTRSPLTAGAVEIVFDDPAGNTQEVFHVACRNTGGSSACTGTGSSPVSRALVTSCSPSLDDSDARVSTATSYFCLRDQMRLPANYVGNWAVRCGCGSLGCNPRHHSLASHAAQPHGINLMVEVENSDDVGLASTARCARRCRMSASSAWHANDKMLSFYMKTPGGFDVESGCEGMTVEDDTCSPRIDGGQPVGPRLHHRIQGLNR